MATPSSAERLRALVAQPGIRLMPCCFDALSARLIERAGFELTFMSGFAVSATRLALPDAGLASYGEMVEQAREIAAAVAIPVIGDGDTGYGNAMNVKRTVRGYARRLTCAMIEDQVAPKRCVHAWQTGGVARRGARACAPRSARGTAAPKAATSVMARTDARATHDLDEAIGRERAFAEAAPT
jgi:2-methylisocitrate lyase-like PEP mutase family enzyme